MAVVSGIRNGVGLVGLAVVTAGLAISCVSSSVREPECATRGPAGIGGHCAGVWSPQTSEQRVRRLREFFRRRSQELPDTGIRWSSRFLSPERPVSQARIRELVDRLLDPKDPLNEEIRQYQTDLAGKNSSAFWDLYFRMYDTILDSCDGYLDIFIKASRYLPGEGRIVDYGFGTANGAASLVLLEPGRRLEGVDFSEAGLRWAQAKMHQVALETGGTEARLQVADLTAHRWPENSLDGALMNNVFYAIPEALRPALLEKIKAELKPGARFVISDPHDGLQAGPQSARDLILSVMLSAGRNGSAMSEFDIAFFGFLNVKFLFGGGKFLSRQELAGMARAAGFEIEKEESSYYGGATFLVLRKP